MCVCGVAAGNTAAVSAYVRLLLSKLGLNARLYNSGLLAGRRRLGEEEDEDEGVAPPDTQSASNGAAEEGGPFCFPLAANDEKYQPFLTDCKVVDQGFEDAGACCVQCSNTANCTGFSYISGGRPAVHSPDAVLELGSSADVTLALSTTPSLYSVFQPGFGCYFFCLFCIVLFLASIVAV